MSEEPETGSRKTAATEEPPPGDSTDPAPDVEAPAGSRREPIVLELGLLMEGEGEAAAEESAEAGASEEAEEPREAIARTPEPSVACQVVEEAKKPGSILSLVLEIAASDYRQEVDRYYGKLRKDVTLPGYRKGRAPIRLIRIRMGEEADVDALSELALQVARREVKRRGLKLAGDAQVTNWEGGETEPLRLTIDFEVEPTVELETYKGFEVEIHTHEITEEAVQGELERLRERAATLEAAPEASTVDQADEIEIDLKVFGDKGQELNHLRREGLRLAQYRERLPEPLAAALADKRVGETAEARVEAVHTNRRGEEIRHVDTYVAVVRALRQERRPPLDDDFAKDLGEHDTLEELKATLRQRLEERETRRRDAEALGRLLELIAEKNGVEAGRSAIVRIRDQGVRRDAYRLAAMGLSLSQLLDRPERYVRLREQEAARTARQYLTLREVVRREGLEATDEEVEGEIARLAEAERRKPLAVRARLEADKTMDSLRDDIAFRKAERFLLAHNTIIKTPAPAPSAPETSSEGEAEESS